MTEEAERMRGVMATGSGGAACRHATGAPAAGAHPRRRGRGVVAVCLETALVLAALWPGGRPSAAGGPRRDLCPGGWVRAAGMRAPRLFQTATPLTDGRVLVAGGGGPPSAELYDPRAGTWTATERMRAFRYNHTATRLADGRVLVVGGNGGGNTVLASAELYDPRTGRWAATGRMHSARAFHTATLLPDGRVLVAGGQGTTDSGGPALVSAELYAPRTGRWAATGAMRAPHRSHTATVLRAGLVLVVGGRVGADLAGDRSAELYDPRRGAWATTGVLHAGRVAHTATLLLDGRVLVAGGSGAGGSGAGAEVYDPRGGRWSITGSLRAARLGHTATLLPDGRVLVAGGTTPTTFALTSAELYDPRVGRWASAGRMHVGRTGHTATLLLDGRVLVAGAVRLVTGDALRPLAAAELYVPGAPATPWGGVGAC